MRFISIQTVEGKKEYAINKARGDIDRITDSLHYKPLILGSHSKIGFVRVLKRYYDIFSLPFYLKKGDDVFFQYPWVHSNGALFYDSLIRSKANIDCMIHDLDFLRYKDRNDINHLKILGSFRTLIVHTPAMKKYLVDKGIEPSKIRILYLFSYITGDSLVENNLNEEKKSIVFAGNLEKSPFVNKLKEIASENFKFNLYGKGFNTSENDKNIEHKGVFDPSHPGLIEGNWGLVWDGYSLNTCDGPFGEYLKINSSHKISLYLSCGIPVILWEKSSLKDYILQNKLGIVVNSLYELEDKIRGLSDEELNEIKRNVIKMSKILRSGEPLKTIIKNLQG